MYIPRTNYHDQQLNCLFYPFHFYATDAACSKDKDKEVWLSHFLPTHPQIVFSHFQTSAPTDADLSDITWGKVIRLYADQKSFLQPRPVNKCSCIKQVEIPFKVFRKIEHLHFHDNWANSEEDGVMWLKAPQQPLNGPWIEIVSRVKKLISVDKSFKLPGTLKISYGL